METTETLRPRLTASERARLSATTMSLVVALTLARRLNSRIAGTATAESIATIDSVTISSIIVKPRDRCRAAPGGRWVNWPMRYRIRGVPDTVP